MSRWTLATINQALIWRALDDAEAAVRRGECSIEEAAECYHVSPVSLRQRFEADDDQQPF